MFIVAHIIIRRHHRQTALASLLVVNLANCSLRPNLGRGLYICFVSNCTSALESAKDLPFPYTRMVGNGDQNAFLHTSSSNTGCQNVTLYGSLVYPVHHTVAAMRPTARSAEQTERRHIDNGDRTGSA